MGLRRIKRGECDGSADRQMVGWVDLAWGIPGGVCGYIRYPVRIQLTQRIENQHLCFFV